jgi:hypothetical protein
MPSSKQMSGLNAIMPMNKEIDTDDQDEQSTKVVKLRFTRKQYQAFRDACKILDIVSQDPGFHDFVKSALKADVKASSINKQLVQPILEAPTKIPIKLPKATSTADGKKRESYFTLPVEVTEKCLELYRRVDEEVDLKHDVREGITCVTDVRVMMSKYISSHDLRNEHGIVIDDFIRELAPKSLHENSEYIHRIMGKHIIPKSDRKVITGIINEVTFGK